MDAYCPLSEKADAVYGKNKEMQNFFIKTKSPAEAELLYGNHKYYRLEKTKYLLVVFLSLLFFIFVFYLLISFPEYVPCKGKYDQ